MTCLIYSHHRKPYVGRSLSIRGGYSFRSIEHEDDDVREEKEKIIQGDSNGHSAESTHAVVVKVRTILSKILLLLLIIIIITIIIGFIANVMEYYIRVAI